MSDKYRAVFLFCPECNNLLQPNEDKHLRKLVYRCRNCTYSRPAREGVVEEQCVHRRDITFIAKEDIVVPEGVIYDPSLARNYNYSCDHCDGTEAVFYRLAESIVSDAMALIFVCCKCGHWRREGKEELPLNRAED
ncbi:unnamed protein product [Amoebophrya sp. A25]|nr:unnamed protein product [Amoebophrya sp. A25]|eukprot:GSA25T00015529001.1